MEKYADFFKNDHFALRIGIEIIHIEPGNAVTQITIGAGHLNAGEVAQGGVLFTLADLAMAAAANANGRLAFSIQSDIRFLESARTGDTLTAEAKEVLLHKTVCHYHVDVTNQHNKLIAVCDGICYRK